jgi:hypothetical protein
VTPPGAAGPDLAEQLYDLAFEALAQGQRGQAIWLLTQLRIQHPEHRLATQAAEIAQLLRTTPPPALPMPAPVPTQTPLAEEPSPAPAEQPSARGKLTSDSARAELVFVQTLHGMALGAEVCAMFECNDTRPWALSLMAGGGVGLAVSLSLSSKGITPGLARALTAGTEWGAWNAVMIGNATDAFTLGNHQGRAVGAGMMLGQLAGLGAGGLLYSQLHPSAAQVSLASSGAIWTTTAVGLSIVLFDVHTVGNAWLWSLAAASDVGLLAGGLLASQHDLSVSRVLLLDAGALVGLATGAGGAVLLAGKDPSSRVVAGGAIVGLLAGLAVSWQLTQHWDSHGNAASQQLSLGVLPAPGGAVATARLLM